MHGLPILALALLPVLWGLIPGAALATPPSPVRDYTLETANKKYVLAVLVPEGMFQGSLPTVLQIRDEYPRSGLYTRTGDLLWRIDWYLPPSLGNPNEWVIPLNDGEHLITWTKPWAGAFIGTSMCDTIAVVIWKRGEELSKYRIGDLVACPGTMQVSDAGGMWRQSFAISQSLRLLLIEGYDERITLLSTTTGRMLVSVYPVYPLAGIGALGIAGYVFVVAAQTRKARQRAAPKVAGKGGDGIVAAVPMTTYRTCPTCYKLIVDPTLTHCPRCGATIES